MKSPKTILPGVINRQWTEIDASKASLGRIATKIANVLRGKHKRNFTPHLDMGDFVVAVNVSKLKFTGRKTEQKQYFRHSGYLGGLKKESLKVLLNQNPAEVLRRAVFSMLDDIKLRKKIMSRLKLVGTNEHKYQVDKHLS